MNYGIAVHPVMSACGVMFIRASDQCVHRASDRAGDCDHEVA